MGKKRILHAIGNLSMGGAEFQCLQLVNNLDRAQYEVAIVYLHEGQAPDVADHVRLCKVDRGSYFDMFGLGRRIDSVVDDFRPDILQAWLPEVISVPAALAAHRRGIPVLSCLRNTLAFEGSWDKALRDRMRCLQYLCADRIVSNFDVWEEPLLFRWLYQNKQGTKIMNGIDLHALKRVEVKSLQKQSKFRVIYAGRLVPQKNLLFALDVLSCLASEGLDVHLTLFGAGPEPYVCDLQSRVALLGIEDNVTFYGECSNWHSFAKDATALLFPTNGEGTSNTVLEALAIGLPTVMSNIQMSRALLRDRVNAIVIDSDSTEVWAQRLVELFSDGALRARIQRAGKALAQEFDLGKMVDAYDSIYQGMLEAKQ